LNRKQDSAKQKQSKPGASDGDLLSIFVRLSRALTGKEALEPDLSMAYFERARAELTTNLDTLLERFAALESSGQDPVSAVRDEIMPNPTLGSAAKLILLLWYIGGIKNVSGDWVMQSADQYYRALVWDAIGAHPPTLSNGYFGHWKYPPES
jgi:Membrane bound FAD containing D-sorbitol dehydrogenase